VTLKIKIGLITMGVLVTGALVLISPFVYLGLKSSNQRRELQNRSDYSQIAAACVTLARTITNDSTIIPANRPGSSALVAISLSALHHRVIE